MLKKVRHVVGPSSFEVSNETLNVLNKKFLLRMRPLKEADAKIKII